jgi:TonB family protein
MKHHLRVVMLIVLVLTIEASTRAQEDREPVSTPPAVTVAVAPNYFLTALHSHASGEVVVEVRINSEGSVTSTEAVSGTPVLAAGSRQVARRWKFAPARDKSIRTARLTFIYRLVPRDTPVNELVAVFKPPYRVEIVHVLPDEERLPQSLSKKRIRANPKAIERKPR